MSSILNAAKLFIAGYTELLLKSLILLPTVQQCPEFMYMLAVAR